ncbi:MAG: protein kinase [Gemmatimonadaceae bacterium]|nr:protein kinase [Gemmatimonadaceae bacterium]NUS32834.1 protein kinase [Gemmatimonadaceae bacterium]
MTTAGLTLPPSRRVPDPLASAADDELRAHVQRALAAHYELDCEIGRGGMGIVYRAKDRRLKRPVAIKLLPPELAFRSEIKSRFLREAETAAQLSHPNIVPIYTVDELEQLVFFVMAYVSGDNLAKRLHERGVLTVEETRKVLREVADALAYAHDRGVVHRDIKPDNILLDAVTGRPMVTDFGIARAMDSTGDSRLTATGMAIGTPAYMSPEQAAGEREIDGRSDLYSLGILGYQMLTGEPPFAAGSTPAMLVKHISERPVPVEQRRADIPPDLARSVMMLLEKDPGSRFPTASALVAALDSREMIPTRRPTAPAPAANPAPAAPMRPLYTSPADGPYAPGPALVGARPLAGATSDELRRWEAPPVIQFRRKIAPYLFVNGVIVLFTLFGSSDFFFVTVLWSIYIAFKYAKLWSEGYDWRDVFRQPREKEIMEVLEEAGSYLRALFDPAERARQREARAQRKLAARMAPPALPAGFDASPAASYAALQIAGPLGDRVRQAFADRDEILRRVNDLPKSQKEQLGDVSRSAMALAEKVQGLALAYDEASRQDIGSAREQLEGEIRTLEGAANPLERGSEDRVRRLAYLKRQRRALVDAAQRKDTLSAKLETCALALQNMRFDLMRLGASPQMHQHITSLANQAMKLTENVDDALFVADEMGRASSRRSSGGAAARATERG